MLSGGSKTNDSEPYEIVKVNMKVNDLKALMEDFRSELVKHRDLYNKSLDRDLPQFPIRNADQLNEQAQSLARSLGGLLPYLKKFDAQSILHHQATGMSWEIFETAIHPAAVAQMKGPSLKHAIQKIDIILGQLDSMNNQDEVLEHGSLQSGRLESGTRAVSGNRVFLVHGHDEAVLQEVARFLEKLELQVTILREQPNKGRTIIEKFEDYSDVGFAIVLLTPDDRGGPKAEPYDDQKLRARQNVILELGFFLGKLGRERVCAAYKEGVEIPSDYTGVLFIPHDRNGAWRLLLAQEIKAATLNIDMNKAIG